MFVDTHCHLNLNLYQDDLEDVLTRAHLAGVERIVVPGIDLPTSRKAVQLSEQHPELFAAVGVHPNDASTWTKDSLVELEKLAGHERVVAIGEIGLDYYRQHTPHDMQKRILELQLDLAQKVSKPVILHNRESFSDLWHILQSWQIELQDNKSPLSICPGVMHSFDGSLAEASLAADHGFLIGISGPVTFHNAAIRQTVATGLPLDCLLTETDAPFLTPHPYRGHRNEPSFVTLIAEKIAHLHEKSLLETADILIRNADTIFGWRNNA